MAEKQFRGSAGTPLKLRTNAVRQTEEKVSPRLNRTRQRSDVIEEKTDDAWTVEKPHTSAYRYDYPTTRKTSQFQAKPTKVIKYRHFDRATFIIWLCIALIVMIVGWWLFSLVANWWQGVQNDWRYGTPRTYQTDQFVGQGDSPDHPDHFIVVNTHGQVIVVQINPQHPQLDHMYGITQTSDPKIPVSLTFRPTGTTWAMFVIIGDTNPYSVELISDGKQFVSPH